MPGLVEVGRYRSVRAANERALVVLAMRLGYWIFQEPETGRFVLCVEERHRDAVMRELAEYERERRPWRRMLREELDPGRSSALSIFVFIWVMLIFHGIQAAGPEWWLERGRASSVEMTAAGQWWRAVTALTLHADLAHLGANMAAGALFAWFLLPHLGGGVTWLATLGAGVLGNVLNNLGYGSQPHLSIGASTAVFGALGILVAIGMAQRLRVHRSLRRHAVLLPIGGGLALLAFLGASGRNTDYLAHLWGLVAGGGIGLVLARHARRCARSGLLQAAAAGLALLILAGAWFAAAPAD